MEAAMLVPAKAGQPHAQPCCPLNGDLKQIHVVQQKSQATT